MSKLRVYELARELGKDSKTLIKELQGLGIDVASHQNVLTEDQVAKIRKTTAQPSKSVGVKSPKLVVRRRKKVVETPTTDLGEETPTTDLGEESNESKENSGAQIESVAAENVALKQDLKSPKTDKEIVVSLDSELKAPILTPQKSEVNEISSDKDTKNDTIKIKTKEKTEKKLGGATIVRRATPEETKALELQKEKTRSKTKKDDPRSIKLNSSLGFKRSTGA